MRAQRLIDVMLDVGVFEIVDVAAVESAHEHLLGFRRAALRERDRLVLFVDDVVAGGFQRVALFGLRIAAHDGARLQLRHDAIDLVIEIGRHLGRPGDDQRRARFVDQDAVHLVDDREVVAALDVMRELELHVVAQVVEAELVVRAVGDVRGVCRLAFHVVHVVLDDSRRSCRGLINPAHPLGVAAGQVVVDGHDVDALALERVEIGRQRGDERFAFAGFHLGDLPGVQDARRRSAGRRNGACSTRADRPRGPPQTPQAGGR